MFSNQNLDNTQNITDYTEQELIRSSSTMIINQNTTNRVKLAEEKFCTILLLLESPKSKDFQSLDLEIDFLTDSGAESNIKKIPTWNEIQPLHSKLIP